MPQRFIPGKPRSDPVDHRAELGPPPIGVYAMSRGDRGSFRCLHKPRTMPRSPPLPAQTRHTTKITIYGCSTKARLYAQSPMSSYPRRTFALRPGRDASHDRYTSTAVPLDDRHVLTLISLEHHELTPWIRLGTGSLDARRRRRRPKSRTTSSSDEAADPEPIDQRRDPGRCCKCSGALADPILQLTHQI